MSKVTESLPPSDVERCCLAPTPRSVVYAIRCLVHRLRDLGSAGENRHTTRFIEEGFFRSTACDIAGPAREGPKLVPQRFLKGV